MLVRYVDFKQVPKPKGLGAALALGERALHFGFLVLYSVSGAHVFYKEPISVETHVATFYLALKRFVIYVNALDMSMETSVKNFHAEQTLHWFIFAFSRFYLNCFFCFSFWFCFRFSFYFYFLTHSKIRNFCVNLKATFLRSDYYYIFKHKKFIDSQNCYFIKPLTINCSTGEME